MRVVLLICVMAFGAVNAQDRIADSLKNVLEHTLNSDADSLSISRAYFKLGKHLSYNNVKESYQYLEKALDIAVKLKHDRAIAINLNIMASNYSDESRHEEAIKMYERGHNIFLKMGEPSKAADILMNIATTYVDLGQYEKALKTELDALQLKISSKDSVNIANYYVEIGIVYDILDNKLKHKEYILKAFKLAENPYYSNFYTTQQILNQLGRVYSNEDNFDLAIMTYNNMYEQAKKEAYPRGISTGLSNMSEIYYKTKQYKKALPLAREAFSLSKKIGNDYKILASGNKLAQILVKMGKFKSARELLTSSINNYENKSYPAELQRSYKICYEMHKSQNNPAKALVFLEKYENIKDSLRSLDINEKILEMETKFKTVEKDKKIALLNKDKELQSARIERQHLLIISISVLIILCTIAVYYIYKRKKEKYLLEKTNSELKMLRAQLNPHFIFNSLGAIQNYIINNNNIIASDYLADFSKLIRLILDSSRSDRILLSDEIILLEKYLNLQKLRYSNSFEYQINNSASGDVKIPPMLTQPFIENAIEHGVSAFKNNEGKINIELKEDSEHLLIEISDNGPGMNTPNNQSSHKGHRSHSMEIIKERIENLNRQKSNYINFTTSDLSAENKSGTKITFKISLN